MLLTWVLAWAHVISAISWLGGGILFGFVIGPGLATLASASRDDFWLKVAPRIGRFFAVVAVLTILFGVLLLFNLGGLALLSFSTRYGMLLSIGMAVALVAFVLSEFVTVPALFLVVRLKRQQQENAAPVPPAQLARTLKLFEASSVLIGFLLIVSSIFMVGAGFY